MGGSYARLAASRAERYGLHVIPRAQAPGWRPLAIGALAVVLVAAPSATATQVTVTATLGSSFSPARVTIAPNDSVVWRNLGGDHNVKFDDGAFEAPADPSSAAWTTPARVFPTPGRFTYYCERHGGPNLSGMAGRVVVEAPGSADTVPPVVSRARLRVRGKGLVLGFVTSESGRAVVKLQRRAGGRFRSVRAVRRRVAQGRVSVRLRRDRRGRALRRGRYRAVVTVRDAAGNRSRAARVTARIRRSG
jgi:plastocyanin